MGALPKVPVSRDFNIYTQIYFRSAFSGNFWVSIEVARIAPNSQAIAGLGAGGSWNEKALPTVREQMCPQRGTDASNRGFARMGVAG